MVSRWIILLVKTQWNSNTKHNRWNVYLSAYFICFSSQIVKIQTPLIYIGVPSYLNTTKEIWTRQTNFILFFWKSNWLPNPGKYTVSSLSSLETSISWVSIWQVQQYLPGLRNRLELWAAGAFVGKSRLS